MTMKLIIVLALFCVKNIAGSWETWWTYDGISGPSYWGLVNPEWSICNKGKSQSPTNIETNKLLFDPRLTDLNFEGHKVNGILQNTGQSLVFRVVNESEGQVKFSKGPLSYNYQFEGIHFHYGQNDSLGSEHQINGKHFPGEIQFYAFNKDLYHNMSEAQQKSQGVVVISVVVQIGDPTAEFRLLSSVLTKVAFKGDSHPINNLTISSLLPNTREYLTYEGSFTQPGCWESVVWIIYNKPIYISKQEMYTFRRLMQGTRDSPKSPLGNNVRPVQGSCLTIRTNINPRTVSGNSSYLYIEAQGSENGQRDDLPLISLE